MISLSDDRMSPDDKWEGGRVRGHTYAEGTHGAFTAIGPIPAPIGLPPQSRLNHCIPERIRADASCSERADEHPL